MKLADTCEEQQQWAKHAEALSRLYDIVKEKGNIERAISLAESIIASYMKVKLFDKCKSFCINHIFSSEFSPSHQHMMKMITMNIEVSTSLEKGMKIISQDNRQTFDEQSKVYKSCMNTILQLQLQVGNAIKKVQQSSSLVLSPIVKQFLVTYVIRLRSQLILIATTSVTASSSPTSVTAATTVSTTTAPKPTVIDWNRILKESIAVCKVFITDSKTDSGISQKSTDEISGNRQSLDILLDIICESWFLYSDSAQSISNGSVDSLEPISYDSLITEILSHCSSSYLAVCTIKAMMYLQTRPYVQQCSQYWVATLNTSSINSSGNSSGNIISTAAISSTTSTGSNLSTISSASIQQSQSQPVPASLGDKTTAALKSSTLASEFNVTLSVQSLSLFVTAIGTSLDGIRSSTITTPITNSTATTTTAAATNNNNNNNETRTSSSNNTESMIGRSSCLSIEQYLHITAEAKRKEAWIRKNLGTVRSDMTQLLQLSAVIAYLTVGQTVGAIQVLKYLSKYFKVVPVTPLSSTPSSSSSSTPVLVDGGN